MVRISIERFRLARLLAGVLLVLLGVAQLWDRGGERPGEPAGWVLIALGLIIAGFRHYLEADGTRGRLARRMGVFRGFILKSFHTDAFKSIALTSRQRSNRDHEYTAYLIRIGGEGGGELCELRNMGFARFVTERLCRTLQVSMENRLLGGSSKRTPAELGTPLAERWSLSGKHKEAPTLPPETQLIMELGETYSELSAPVKRISRGLFVGIFVAALAISIVWYRLDADSLVIGILISAIAAWICVQAVALQTGRNRIRFTADTVEVRRGLLWRKRMKLAEVEEILASRNDIMLMGDQQYLCIEKAEMEADAAVQRQFIERQIAQRQPGSSQPE